MELTWRVMDRSDDPSGRIVVGHMIYAFTFGGEERELLNIIRYGDKERFLHVVVSFTEVGAFGEEARRLGFRVLSLKKTMGNDFSLPFRIAKLIRMYGVRVIHARGWATLVETALASRLARVRGSIYAFHGRTYDDLRGQSIKRQMIQSFFVRAYDRIVTLNPLMKRELSRECRLSEDKIDVIANGIELDRFSPSSNRSVLREAHRIPLDRFVIGNVGRLDPVKDHETLLRAVDGLKQCGRKPYLLIVGEGQSRAALESAIASLGLTEDVRLYGFSKRIPELLNCMDVYVQSSLYEGSSHTLVEAMACGLPVVATDVGGTADLFDEGREGFRFKPRDENALQELIAKIQDDPQLRRTMGYHARDRALKFFSVETMVKRYEQIYHELATLR